MTITAESWKFIEKYLPNYSGRDDVLRQSNLQLFTDGHDTTVEGVIMDMGEAENELHHILYNLYYEAIDAYTKALGRECEHCKNEPGYFCSQCGKLLKDKQEIPNTWRCSQCGSKDVQIKAWVNANKQEYIEDAAFDEQDFYCNYCKENTQQLQENELSNQIDEWWRQVDGIEMEIITGLEHMSYCTEPDPDKAFDADCNEYWNNFSVEQKIAIWKHFNYNNGEN